MKPSIQYQISNIILPVDVLNHPQEFFEKVIITNTLPEYIAWQWNRIKENVIKQGLDFQDVNKEITAADIKCQVFFLQTNFLAMLIEFPDYYVNDATSKYGLITSASYMPMSYFTLEYGQDVLTKTPLFFTGRWVLNDKGSIQHVNYGITKDKEEFIKKTFSVLQRENPEHNINDLIDQVCHPENLISTTPK